jgi:hypothetical protein
LTRTGPGDSMEGMETAAAADYLVVGAGAAGMAFTDALIDHADVRVVLVDRRHGAGGHWLDAYPFVRLHQASVFYGVASTLLGGGRTQAEGPEAGLQERASAPEVSAYYDRVLHEHLLASGRVDFRPNCEYEGEGRIVSRVSGTVQRIDARVVDAHYLSPVIPANSPAPFDVGEGVIVVTPNDLVHLAEAPSQYVVAGSGKTATDTCIWLMENGVEPDAIVWVRPRDPWMLNRAVVQPDPAVALGLSADTVQAAAEATTVDDMFLHLEEFGDMLRIDEAVTPTMARTPTLARWELDRLRTVENVVRLGHLRRVERGRLLLDDGEVAVADDAVVVHAAAPGLLVRPPVQIWGEDTITLQPVRAGFPCFGAALIGYVEATVDGDEEKNRLCPPSVYSDSLAEWARLQTLGYRAVQAFSADPDVKAWADGVVLNPARVPPGGLTGPGVDDALERVRRYQGPGMARMAEFAALAQR